MTDAAELALVETEISRRYAGGAVDKYAMQGDGHAREITRASLEWLCKRKDELTFRIASSAASTGGSFNYARRGDY